MRAWRVTSSIVAGGRVAALAAPVTPDARLAAADRQAPVMALSGAVAWRISHPAGYASMRQVRHWRRGRWIRKSSGARAWQIGAARSSPSSTSSAA